MKRALFVLILFLAAQGDAGQLYPVSHCRIVDTRLTSTPEMMPGDVRTFVATQADNTNQGGEARRCIPSTATAVFVNIATRAPYGPGNLKLWAANESEPLSTFINYWAVYQNGTTVYATPVNSGWVKIDSLGQFKVKASTSEIESLVIDVQAYSE